MSARKTTPGSSGGLGAIPRGVILAIGCVIWLAAFFSGLPKWIATGVAVVVGLVFMVDHQIRSMKGLDDVKRRERTRNLAIALALAGMVVLFYLATIVRLGPNVWNRPM